MGHNRGKEFESEIKSQLLNLKDVDVQRLYDTTNGFVGVKQPSDYILYKYPYQYYLECKSTNSHTLNRNNITQLEALNEKSKIFGVVACVIIWFIEDEVTVLVPVETLINHFYNRNKKSVSVKEILNGDLINSGKFFEIKGNKRRVFFDYDFNLMFKEIEDWQVQKNLKTMKKDVQGAYISKE